MNKTGWIAVTGTGRHYARRIMDFMPAFQTHIETWDATELREEAYIFRTKAAAEKHASVWPEGWRVEKVSVKKSD